MMTIPACRLKTLPPHQQAEGARRAIEVNPANRPLLLLAWEMLQRHAGCEPAAVPRHEMLAVLTSKWWGGGGVRLTVGFLDGPDAETRRLILAHMNAWSKYANVSFVESGADAQVRIARAEDGYWSYLGTDVLSIPPGEPTMNLQGFTAGTPESEYKRVVRHETGHTLGCPHEHLRRELIGRLDRQRTVDYFRRADGWSEQTTIEQVLTPLEEASLMATPHADQDSIMCYMLPGEITTDGEPVVGGTDIDPADGAFIARVYPLPAAPPPPPSSGGARLFGLSFARPVPRGGTVSFRAPVAVPKGAYDVVGAAGRGPKTARAAPAKDD